ncbi:MAG TPA: caspase family protein [Blastocatellia bacterium]|nr:caspase family protein [Blastocatellia bacterium]
MRLKLLALASIFALACPFFSGTALARGRQEQAAKTWAVVIGVSKYSKLPGGQQLQFADGDAMAFAESLKKGGASPSNIRLLVGPDATIASIKSAIGNWLARSASEQDTVYIFFSGHGLAERDFREAYLLAYDSDTANPYGTALSISDVRKALEGRVRARRVLLIADPIRRDLFPDDERAAGTAVFTQAFEQLASAREGISAILGSGPGEFAREGRAWGGQGIFTKVLIDALSGSADANQDSLVSAGEAFDHVSARVAQETSDKQHPWRAGALPSDTVLARAARAPAPAQSAQPATKIAVAEVKPADSSNTKPPALSESPTVADSKPKADPKPETAAPASTPKPITNRPAPEKALANTQKRPEPEAPRQAPAGNPSKEQAGVNAAPARPSQNEAASSSTSEAATQVAQNKEARNKDDLIAKANPEPAKPEASIPSPPPPKPAPSPPVTSAVAPAPVRSRVEPVTASLPKMEATAAPSPLSLQVEAAISSNRLIEPRGGSAWELYQKLAQEQPGSSEAGRLKPMLAAALHESGRAIVAGDITADNISEKVDEFKRAGQMFSRARALSPGDPTLADLEKLSAAQALLALQFFEEAERSLSQVQGERSAFLENTLGLIYFGRLDSFRAERAFKRAAELKPDWATPLINLAMVYRHEKNDAALETLERAASLDSQNAATLQALGDEYFGREKWQQAIDAFRKAAEIRPEDDTLHTKLGHALYSLGQRDEANRAYQKAQEIRNRKK